MARRSPSGWGWNDARSEAEVTNEGFSVSFSPDQGIAFVEALTGMEPDGRGNAVPKSAHARTALAAILGQAGVPFAGDILQWVNGNKNIQGYPEKLRRFVIYLRAVASALEKLLPAEDRTTPEGHTP